MDKKELSLTTAKELVLDYKISLGSKTTEKKIEALGKYLSQIVKEVAKVYDAIE